MDLALNNLQRLDMPLNKETKPINIFLISFEMYRVFYKIEIIS